MKLHILAVGERMPRWVNEACVDYQHRFPRHCSLSIRPLAAPRRRKDSDVSKLKEKEFEALSAARPNGARIVALEETGSAWTSNELAQRLSNWMHPEKHVVFLIGGADGLAPAALEAACDQWSLSRLTLPHALARVIVAEQLYRAMSIVTGHPYHCGHL